MITNNSFSTVPNQRTVTVKREQVKSDFLGIKNDNWKAAARNMRPHAFLLYIYFASNADGYTFALSPEAIRKEIGMARSTYHDQFKILVDKGYLVQTGGNTYTFYETPQPRPPLQEEQEMIEPATVGYDFENMTIVGFPCTNDGQNDTVTDIEINNKYSINSNQNKYYNF